ncbi:MAG: hypothetical protein V3V16_05570 [Melioribacteraceae bacterium]
MQKLLTLVLVIGFLFVGCQDDSMLLQPEVEFDATSIQSIPKDNSAKASTISEYTIVKDKYSRTYTINGNKGGKIIEKHTWSNGTESLKLEAYLTIPKGAFEGELTFEMVFDPNLLSVELHPTPFTFDIPVILDLKYKGITKDFEINPDSLDFQYYKLDGTFENVDYKNIKWNPNSRTLMVFDAELHHFSRYGWTRTKPSLY